MYDEMTFENILDRMLERAKEVTGVDTSVGSLIYSVLAPEAWELAEAYIAISNVYDTTFADTAPREELLKRGLERGLTPNAATKAILKGEFNINIPLDSRFTLGELSYKAIEKISDGIYKMECESAGTDGNKKLGELIQDSYIDGLETARLTELLKEGEDEEDTEDFRQRYFDSFETIYFGGNRADYKKKICEIDGVGGVKLDRVTDEEKYIRATIITSNYTVPSETLIEYVQNVIDPGKEGDGDGVAPIGHCVKITGVESYTIEFSCRLSISSAVTIEDIEDELNGTIDTYLQELSKVWESNEHIIVRIEHIKAGLLSVNGVLDITDALLNGRTYNTELGRYQIPVRGTVVYGSQ